MGTFVYLDLAGYQRLSLLPLESLQWLASRVPGWIEGRVGFWSSWLNAQARKRYGVGYKGTSLPFGQVPPVLVPTNPAAPVVGLVGRPFVGSDEFTAEMTHTGPLGVSTFQVSRDGGKTWEGGATPTQFTTAASVPIPGTGVALTFEAGTYTSGDVWNAPTAVAAIVLGWLVRLLDLDVMRKRGSNPQDPAYLLLVDEVAAVRVEVQQAADGKDGLWELPTVDEGNNAVTEGGVLSYSEASPYVSADMMEREGHHEDIHGHGTYGGS